MRRNWTEQEDTVLRNIVHSMVSPDWAEVASELRINYKHVTRTGKQCRQRWYNHLDPIVRKCPWTYAEETLLFEKQRHLGNRWKQISHCFPGRTDNNIKNQFYSTLRRSLRRLNKIIGKKNSTLSMREIKPSVLTIILNFIYDHDGMQHEFVNELKGILVDISDLPKLIFEYASFKPIKDNISSVVKQGCRQKIQTIFNLVHQFKQSYFNEKQDEKDDKIESEQQQYSLKMQQSKEQVPFDMSYLQGTPVGTIASKRELDDRITYSTDHFIRFLDVEEPTPISCFQQNPFPQLVIIGKQLQPKEQQLQELELFREKQAEFDQIFAINYQ